MCFFCGCCTDPPTEPPSMPPTPSVESLANVNDDTKPYIYVDFENTISYESANTFCKEQLGTTLATLDVTDTRNSQQQLVAEMDTLCRSGGENCWIGLLWSNLTNNFDWENGQVMVTNNNIHPWQNGEPVPASALGILDFCVMLHKDANYQWKNIVCVADDDAATSVSAALCDNPKYLKNPTPAPTFAPTAIPSNSPSDVPTNYPTSTPTHMPTKIPSSNPTQHPTSKDPTQFPSMNPTTNAPSKIPSNIPSRSPTENPSHDPTTVPSNYPTSHPTINPSKHPSFGPSNNPTLQPTPIPTEIPSANPTMSPELMPTTHPTQPLSFIPSTDAPSKSPSNIPSNDPTENPSLFPSTYPTAKRRPKKSCKDIDIDHLLLDCSAEFKEKEKELGSIQGKLTSMTKDVNGVKSECNAKMAGIRKALTGRIAALEKQLEEIGGGFAAQSAPMDVLDYNNVPRDAFGGYSDLVIISLVIFNIGTVLGFASCLYWNKKAARGVEIFDELEK